MKTTERTVHLTERYMQIHAEVWPLAEVLAHKTTADTARCRMIWRWICVGEAMPERIHTLGDLWQSVQIPHEVTPWLVVFRSHNRLPKTAVFNTRRTGTPILKHTMAIVRATQIGIER